MLWRLWGPLTWLYYRGWPANTGPNTCYGDFGAFNLAVLYIDLGWTTIDCTHSFQHWKPLPLTTLLHYLFSCAELVKLSAEVGDDLILIAEKKKEDTNNEETFQSQHGERSPSQITASLWKEADNFSKFHSQAVSSLHHHYSHSDWSKQKSINAVALLLHTCNYVHTHTYAHTHTPTHTHSPSPMQSWSRCLVSTTSTCCYSLAP